MTSENSANGIVTLIIVTLSQFLLNFRKNSVFQ